MASDVNPWDLDALRSLRQVANDLTALSATLEVLRGQRPRDAEVERAADLVERMIGSVDAIVGRLRER